jgi:hypothetical protein
MSSILDREPFAQRLHGLEGGVQLVGREVDQRRIFRARQIGGRQRSQRIRERHRAEAESLQMLWQGGVVHEPTHRHRGSGRNSPLLQSGVGAMDFFAQAGYAPIGIVHCARGRIDRNTHLRETGIRQCVDPSFRQQRTVGVEDRHHPDPGCVSDHRREIPVHEGLTAVEVHDSNAVAPQDVAGVFCVGERHPAS